MLRKSLYALTVCIALSIANTATSKPVERVYRSDFRPPEDVFKNGFVAPGSKNSVLDHVLGTTCKAGTTAFIPTSSDEPFLRESWALDGLYMQPGREHIYIYEIDTNMNFYNATRSLLYAHAQTGVSMYQTTAGRFQQQYEWLALGEIPPSAIISASEYSRGPSTIGAQLVGGRVLLNGNYQPSREHPDEDHSYNVINHEEVTSFTADLAVNSSSVDSGACFSSCFPRQRESRSVDDKCALSTFEDVYQKYPDSSFISSMTGKMVTSSVPWHSRHVITNYDYIKRYIPAFCTFRADGYQTIYIRCDKKSSSHRFFKKYAVVLRGGGSSYLWFSKVFITDKEEISIKASDVPVLGTRYTLNDYKDRWWFSGIFTGEYVNWWSSIKVLPIYPDIDPKYYNSYIYTGMKL